MRAILLGLVAAAGLSAGCGQDERFFIVQNQVPTGGCIITPNVDVYRGEGTMDVELVSSTSTFGYVLFPLLQNDFPSTGGGGAPEANRLFVRAFRVRVEPGDGAPARVFELFDRLAGSDQTRPLIEYQEPWAGTLEPGGRLPAGVGVIPAELARQLRATRVLDTAQTVPLTVRVRAVGQRSDGEIESKEFVYPIEACQGCLIADLRPCPYMPLRTGNACNISQDSMVDCCSAGVELTCPANSAAAAR